MSTPRLHSTISSLNPEDYDDRNEPKRIIALSEIYNDTEEVDLEEELLYVGVEEPATYSQAVKTRNWKIAMKAEIDSIERNMTWELVKPPKGHKVIGLKWIYKIKKDAEENIVKYKARLVANGYAHEQ